MDFGTLLHKAQKNENSSKKEIKYYSTKFEPPKKEQRSKQLSANIKKFLAKKELEEQQKSEEAKKRRDQLLELRSKDKKAVKRVNVMLKRTKSANQAVIDDAVDDDNTAVTLAGPSQPDEDDYGYVSQSAADYYNKMMEKYNKMPDEPKFKLEKKKVSTNLSSTKDRVKAALEREREEAMQPHRRKRKSGETSSNTPAEEKEEKYDKYVKEDKKVVKPKLKAAPVINFADLLKIAEKKQFEPIVIENKKDKEEERLLTKKQRREFERDRELREGKERREQERNQQANGPPPNKIPKVADKVPKSNGDTRVHKSNSENKVPTNGHRMSGSNDRIPKSSAGNRPDDRSSRPTSSNNNNTSKLQKRLEMPPKEDVRKVPEKSKQQFRDQKSKPLPPQGKPKEFPPRDLKPKQFPPKDLKPKQFPPSDLKPKQFPPRDLKPKQFPPADVRRPQQGGMRRKQPMISKGKMYDDDDEDYDSEMDDFIDDGNEEEEDYSKYISEIFGYDKKKYRYIDEEDDGNMEATFAQQMREESISTKLGIMEDLEDMKQEEADKKRKALMKKKMKR